MRRKKTGPYVFDEHQRVWSRGEADTGFHYTDGEAIEQQLLTVVSTADDLSVLSPELRQHLKDWPSHYHLSALRANLLRPLGELLQKRVLEVGAGCGAITRYLGELGGEVLALEGSRMRARIAAARCRDLQNVSVFCERFEDFESDEVFDAITLIGVLEYARVMGRGPDPVRNLLRHCERFLSQDGCLIIAIENQVGLKYLAGSVEDHTLVAMHGINDMYDEDSVVTFGRFELEGILREAGFAHVDLLIPLPDYKLPTSVLFPQGYAGKSAAFDSGALLSQSAFADRQKPLLPLFSLERAWPVVARNHLAADLANSFLFVARRSEHHASLGRSNQGVLLKHYSAERRKEWCKQLTIVDSGSNLQIRKDPLVATAPPDLPISVMWQEEEYVQGEIWSDNLTRILNRSWLLEEVTRWAAPWISLLKAQADGASLSSHLPNNYLDATPFNLVRETNGSFRFFDLEWNTRTPPELGHVLFRGLFWTLLRITSVAQPRKPEVQRIHTVISGVFTESGFSVRDRDFQRFIELENRIREWITGSPSTLSFSAFLTTTLNVRQPLERLMGASATADALREQVDRQEIHLQLKASELEKLNSEKAALLDKVVVQDQELRSREGELQCLNQSERTLREQIAFRNAQLQERQSEIEKLKIDLEDDRTIQAERLRGLEAQVFTLQNSRILKAAQVFRGMCKPLLSIHSGILRILYSGAHPWAGRPIAKGISRFGFRGSSLFLPSNPLFDLSYYASNNPDVTGRISNLWAHYLGRGAAEFRNPHPLFDTRYYLLRYPDVAAAGINPLMHFYWRGAAEGRDPHPAFDTSAYVEQYPDVAEIGINPLLHYWLFGRAAGRSATPVVPNASEQLVVASDAESPNRPVRIRGSERSKPLVSVLMPTFNTQERYLKRAIETVMSQSQEDWELCIHDDGSTLAETLETLRAYDGIDDRIRISYGNENRGISNATNAAMNVANGTYVAMLDHDDEITPDALACIHGALTADPSIDAIYSDQAYIGPDGGAIEPFFKPDWSPELFRGVMFVGHFLAVRRSLALELNGFDPRFDRVQDFEFMLRVSETKARIYHLPRILYYWRRIPGSVAFHGDQKGPIEPIQAAAVNAHLGRLGLKAVASPHPTVAHRLVIAPPARTTFPDIAIIVREAAGLRALECARKLLSVSTYPNLKIFVADRDTGAEIHDERIIKGVPAVEVLTESFQHIVWIDASLEVSTPNWIEYFLLYTEQSDVATVAPLIVQKEGTVWHDGLVLGMDGVIGYAMQNWPTGTDGYAGSLSCAREVTAASGECMMISSSALRNVGGQIKYYATSLFDGADIGLRAFTQGLRNIVTPRVVLIKTGSAVLSGLNLDRALFADRWSQLIELGDPYHNRNFSQTSPGYQTASGAPDSDQIASPVVARN